LELLSHATTIQTVLSRQISWETAAQAMISGFQTELNLELVQDDLSDYEIVRAEKLAEEKYNHPAWLERI
jgi:lipoate-protein ligase A